MQIIRLSDAESGWMKVTRERTVMNVRPVIESYIIDNIIFGDCEHLQENVSFQESGVLDSMGFLDIITFVEERFGIEIADGEVIPENFDTLRKMSEFVTRKMNGRTAAR
jgi:acyl carrier protein